MSDAFAVTTPGVRTATASGVLAVTTPGVRTATASGVLAAMTSSDVLAATHDSFTFSDAMFYSPFATVPTGGPFDV
ncbi:hypothetical protein ACFVT1_06460 [Streptomyces sp. NPDC057963]|uniref:hypothetical protein n=1 Tax=Streptomyces sp. NPDC057963 TaxID=3346290 RepID=UPI0036E7E2D6